MSVTRRLERRRRIQFVELEDTCGTVTQRRGRGRRQSPGGARSAERRVGQPSVEEKRRTVAGVEDGGRRGVGEKRRGDDVLDSVV